jgi:tetratricopeptide (TPR) repeat protein
MRKSAAFLLIISGTFAAAAGLAAQTAAPNPAHPWEKDQALQTIVQQEANSGRIMAVQSQVADMEKALAGAKLNYEIDEAGGRISYTLTDGDAEALIATTMAAMGDHDPKTTQAVTVRNPYPGISLCLGSYYNEIGRSADALRVLDAGLALSPVSELSLGEHRAELIGERGAALVGLHRWSDVLADYDDGLKIDDLDKLAKARMDRGRGLALTELGRLDEAEAAYEESLQNEPGNAHALNELKYIARLRAGGRPTPTTLLHVLPAPAESSGSGEPRQH